ncbi:MAG: hypothetical protein WA865_06525 [Spirulinaceae cyanobacterium]
MVLSDITLSSEDFRQVEWEKILEKCDHTICEYYASRFFKAARAAKDEDEVVQNVYEFLGHVTSPMLRSESDSEPFTPCAINPDGSRSAISRDFNNQQLDLLKELAPTIQDTELRARIADIVWERKRDYQMAKLAIRSYLESAQSLEDPQAWSRPFQRIERAYRIAIRLGKKKFFSGKCS